MVLLAHGTQLKSEEFHPNEQRLESPLNTQCVIKIAYVEIFINGHNVQ